MDKIKGCFFIKKKSLFLLMKKILCISFFFMVNLLFSQDIEFYSNINGKVDFTMFGNTLNLTENNDPDATCTILTGSSAVLNLNTSDVIEAAYLYWAGSGSGDFNVNLNGVSITAERTFAASSITHNYFSAFADVTNQVINTGSGNYTLSNLDLTAVIPDYCDTGGNFGGWTIVVVISNDSLPLNQINVYDGLESVYNNNEAIINLDNLNVVDNTGAKIGFLAWEGDTAIAVTESIKINGNILGNPPLNPLNNAFNSTNSFTGSSDLYNMDLDFYSIEDYISIGDSSATIELTSGQDLVMINCVVTKLNSQLSDMTITLDSYTPIDCDQRTIDISYAVSNLSSANKTLPSNVPISFYAFDGTDSTWLQTIYTDNEILVGNDLTLDTELSIPSSVPFDFTLVAKADINESNESTIIEFNEMNNEDTMAISLPQPPIIGTISNLYACDTNFDKIATFNLTDKQTEILNGQSASTYEIHYYLNDTYTSEITDVTAFDSGGQTIYIQMRYTTLQSCTTESSFEIVPVIIEENINNLYSCDTDLDGNAIFNLTNVIDEIADGQDTTAIEINYFLDSDFTTSILDPTAFESTAHQTTIYVQLHRTDFTGCTVFSDFIAEITSTQATASDAVPTLMYCDNDSVGDSFDEKIEFDLEENKNAIINASIDTGYSYTLAYFTDASYSNQITDMHTFTNTSNPQTIYVEMTNDTDTTCRDRTSFLLEVLDIPITIPLITFNQCDDDVDISNNTLLNLTNVNSHISDDYQNETFVYFESLEDAEDGTPIITNPVNYMVTDGDTLWARTINATDCYTITQIDIKVTISNVDYINTIKECDDYAEGISDDQDGISEFDLTQHNYAILDLFPASIRDDLNISFYPAPFENIQLQTNLITNPAKYRNTSSNTLTTPNRIYIKIENNNNLDCAGMGLGLYLDLIVDATPYFEIDNQLICLKDLPKPITVQNTKGVYTYIWKDENGVELDVDVSSSEIAFIPQKGTYTITATNTTNFCTKTKLIDVEISSSPIINTMQIVDNASNNQIALEVDGLGIYEYALDSNDFTSANEIKGHIFYHVSEGVHQIHIRDIKNDCVTLHKEVVVLRYPKYISPNHDNRHDEFYVFGGDDLTILQVTIFDRYGKIIAVLKQNELWHGTYLGKIVPIADYWFRAEFMDRQGKIREHKGHFSLVY